MDLQKLITKAKEAKQKRDLTAALKYYSKAFDVLVKEANVYADSFEDTGYESIEDGKRVWTDTPVFFEKAKEYMKRDKTAAVISNNMGVILAELGDLENAKEWFKQAIELTPDGIKYQDSYRNLEELKK